MYLQWKLCSSVLYGVLWTLIIKWINFQYLDEIPTYTDGTEITEKKNCSVSQHLLQFLGDKIAKKNQEDPCESLVDINRKLITDDPENNIRIRSSPAVFYSFLFQLRHSNSNFSSVLDGKWRHSTDHKFENNSIVFLKLNFKRRH